MRQSPVIVLKFGSSVLRSEQDIPAVVHEIYRWVREGHRVLAVVSAFESKTNELLDHARRYGASPNEASVAALVATGEATSAALLSLGLDRAGIDSVLLDADRIGLRTCGSLLDSELASVDEQKVFRLLEEHPVAVVPGFVGRSECGALALLGRGGSDLTALFLASRLGAERCRLLKDVDGLYDRDPARAGDRARRFETLTWGDAIEVGGEVVQHKSLLFAESNELSFEVTTLQSSGGTLVGAGPTRFYAEHPAAVVPIRVGLLGLGTVGHGVYKAMEADPERFEVTKIAVREVGKHLEDAPAHLLTSDVEKVLDSDCDVIVELIGGTDPAADLAAEALLRGKHFVTANKAVIAERGKSLAELATESGVDLRYSAAAGGAVPVLEAVERLRGSITRVRGCLNGTTTFVLDELAHGADFDDAVRSAQAAGYAEADPTLDLDGSDALQKLVLLARAAFDADFDFAGAWDVERRGIQNISAGEVRDLQAAGKTVRLVASIETAADGLVARVRPEELEGSDPLAETRAAECCLVLELEDGSRQLLRGKGAGRWPTTESVMADLLALSRERQGTQVERHKAAQYAYAGGSR